MEITDIKEATSMSGGKAAGLAMLHKIGVSVPKGFVIEGSDTPSPDEIQRILNMLDDSKKLAVRSSALAEDGRTQSFAGIFETVLNVSPNIEDVQEAISTVIASANSERARSYANNAEQRMNVIIQEMVDPLISGVIFTKATDIDGGHAVVIECVEGLADKLVDGAVTPTRITIRLDGKKLDIDNMKVEGEVIDISPLSNLFPFLQKIIDASETPLDIEWCIDKQNKPYFVQARPITTEFFINNRFGKVGEIISPGYAEGVAYVINEDIPYSMGLFEAIEEAQQIINAIPEDAIPENAILVIRQGIMMESAERLFPRISGIIIEESATLSHAAQITREWRIPSISGYQDATALFPTGTPIVLDATNGNVITDNVQTTSYGYKTFRFERLDCYDSVIPITLNGHTGFLEPTYDGLVLHLPGNKIDKQTVDDMELYIRRTFKAPSMHYIGSEKYIWYFENERFKKLPYYNEINAYMMELIRNKDCSGIEQFCDEILSKVQELIECSGTSASFKESLIIGEILTYFSLILSSLTYGYPLRECYIDSLTALHQTENTFDDLCRNKIENYDDDGVLKRIQDFLNVIERKRKETMDNFYEMVGRPYSHRYLQERTGRCVICLNRAGIFDYDNLPDALYNNVIDAFYDTLGEKDFTNIRKILGGFSFLTEDRGVAPQTIRDGMDR